jgi:hypothetical protein
MGDRRQPVRRRSGADAVVEMNDAASKPALIQELEPRADVARQRALAATHHHRHEKEIALFDQPHANRLAGELGTPDRNFWAPRQISAKSRITAGVSAVLPAVSQRGYRRRAHAVQILQVGLRDLSELIQAGVPGT